MSVDDRHAQPCCGIRKRVARVAQQAHARSLSAVSDDRLRDLPSRARSTEAEHDREQQIGKPRRDQEYAPRKVCRHNAARKARHRPRSLPQQHHNTGKSARGEEEEQRQLDRPSAAGKGRRPHHREREQQEKYAARQEKLHRRIRSADRRAE